MRLHLPTPGPGRIPLVIWVSGGGWRTMGLGGLTWQTWLCDHGFAVAGLEYRTAPDHPFPAAVQDVAAGVRQLRFLADDFALDPRRFALMGDSAGGHLVLLAAGAHDEPEFIDDIHPAIDGSVQAVVSLMPPVDLTRWIRPFMQQVRDFLALHHDSQHSRARQASPLYRLGPGTPPVLLIHGRRDTLVSIEHSRTLYAALRDYDCLVTLHEVVGVGHDSERLYTDVDNRQLILQFLQRRLR